MDHYLMGQSALEARQFFEAERHFRKAQAIATDDQHLEISKKIFEVAKVLRPESCWREFGVWAKAFAATKRWDDLLLVLDEHRSYLPEQQLGLWHELKSEALYHRGSLGRSREHAVAHLDHLLSKRIVPALSRYAQVYTQRFPYSFVFSFMELTAAVMREDVKGAERVVKELGARIRYRWSELEDVKPGGKAGVLEAIHGMVSVMDTQRGEAALLAHYCRILQLVETKSSFAAEDWKKLVELVIDDPTWENLKLCLEAAIAAGESELADEIHRQLKSKKGFSFVKFTKNSPRLKSWLLEHGHDRQRPTQLDKAPPITAADLELDGDALPAAREEAQLDVLGELEDRPLEDNVIHQLRLNSPPLDAVPDLIVTYHMLNFGRVVDWLISHYSDASVEFPRLHKKICYLSVIRDVQKKNHYHALATLEEMLGDSEITLDELKELKYAKAAIYHALGDTNQERALLAEVEAIDPQYRRLRERNW